MKRVLRFHGVNQADPARRVGFHRQSVSRWARRLEREGKKALQRAPRAGRSPCLNADDWRHIERVLKPGPQDLEYETQLWMARQVRNRFVTAQRKPQIGPTFLKYTGLFLTSFLALLCQLH